MNSTDSVGAPMPVQSMIGVLRALAIAQEAHYADSARYAASLDRLRLQPHPDVSVLLALSGPQGWSAVAHRGDWRGRSCVIWVGAVPGPLIPRTERLGRRGREGAIVCDS
jgi:hypothetical protein